MSTWTKRMTFGRTWWGRQWVEAMERIDLDTNRLPRGRRYATGGRVREIQIQEGKVFAKVQGSRPRPYHIHIVLKRFKARQVEKIKQLIRNHPDITSDLLLGILPERMLDLLEKGNIHLLPSHWDEIEAECSCPDWANPCKHLAAVYYIIANEIDKEPLILLDLRGVKKEEIGVAAGGDSQVHEISREEGFIPYSKVRLSSSYSSLDEPRPLPDLSFERLEMETLFSLLPDKPLFYPGGDFKRLLLHAYKRIAEQIEVIEVQENGPDLKETEFYVNHHPDEESFFVCPPDALTLHLSPEQSRNKKVYSKLIPMAAGKRLAPFMKRGRLIEPGPVLDLFLSLPLETDPQRYSPSARCLNVASSVALSLIRAASYIPEVVPYGDGDFSLRYIPLIQAEKEKKAFEFLKNLLPPNLIFRQKDKTVLTAEKGAHYLLSLIITHIVHRFCGVDIQDKLCNAAFRGMPYLAEKFEERQTAKAMMDWLESLSVRKRVFSPLIRIDAGEQGFRVQLEIENKKDPMSPPTPLSHLFSHSSESVRTEVLRQIAVASKYMPVLKSVVHHQGKKAMAIDPPTLAGFLTQAKGVFDLLGIRVMIPKELARLITPRLAIQANLKEEGQTLSYFSLDSMLDFSWQVALGDQRISREEFLALVKKAEGVVRFRDRYLLLKPEEIKAILDRLQKPLPTFTSMEALQAALTGEANGIPFDPDEAFQRALSGLTRVEEICPPSALKADLRPYQERGFQWLYTNTQKGFGACLADDMGLGKTIQAIALLLKLKEEERLSQPALVICPTTLVGNWQKECERFAPDLKTLIYHGMERRLDPSACDVIITTYGIIRREAKRFGEQRWTALIIDEAQNIKNPNADQTQAIKGMKADGYIAMSGTPVENRLTELWSIFDFINRGYLGPVDHFKKQYALPIEKYRDREQTERLRKVTAPFLLRRLKTDKTIIADLPEKRVMEAYCYLTKEQAGLYQQAVECCMKEIEAREGIERKGVIFKLITALKQICNHPAHYLKKGLVEKEMSGKAEKAIVIIDKILAAGEKVLIFTQYKEMGGLLTELIQNELRQTPLFFHGGLIRSKRDHLVEEFQERDRHRVMILSLKAGGSGLNLTAATQVIHYDLWWNPAVEAQATDRTYRIGQRRDVTVHRLITLGTFEEKIDEMIKAKAELAHLTVVTGEQWITELSNKALKELFALSSSPAITA